MTQACQSYRPQAGAPFIWPDQFGTRFTIVVDTEEEFDWTKPLARENRAVTAVAALPDAHRRFADRGVAMTYAIDHPIATDPRAIDIIRGLLEDGRSAVGTQLHPWVNPPFDEEVTPYNSFTGNLPADLEAAKLDNLTDAITDAFGDRPKMYRAGRYGLGPRSLALLASRGYRIDSSMRSGYDYSGEGGPDFSAIGNDAFHAAPGLVELPLTTIYTGVAKRGGIGLYNALGKVPKGRGLFSRAGLLSRVGLTPEEMPLRDVLKAIDVALEGGVRLLSFSFHSPTVETGHTPYVRDAADLRDFYRWWDEVLALLDRRGVANASLDELLAATA